MTAATDSPPLIPKTRDELAVLGCVGIIGAGVSGLAAIKLLRVLSPSAMKIIAVDERFASPAMAAQAKALSFQAVADVSELAKEQPQLIVVSPGVPPEHPVYQLKGPAILSEIDLAYIACPMPIIGVTGTNGKSTVTQLIADLGQALGLGTVAGGNIGVAAAELAAEHISRQKAAKADGGSADAASLWILELSSYQLEQSRYIELKGAVFTSFSEDHQERHKNLTQYFRAKWEIINRISTGGFLVIHKETLRAIAELVPANSLEPTEEQDPSLRAVVIEAQTDADLEKKCSGERQDLYSSLSRSSLSKRILQKDRSLTDAEGQLVQKFTAPFCHYHHNLHNAALAALSLRLYNPARYDMGKISKGLDQFTGLDYRFQPICETPNLAIINDSKSTNLESLVTALKSVADADTLLLVGGVAGSESYGILGHYHSNLKWVLCFGKDGDKIYKELNSIPRKSYSPDLASALALAIAHIEDHLSLARPKRKLVVLFSPGCKSFDEFANFMERGAFFNRTIKSAKGYDTWHNTR